MRVEVGRIDIDGVCGNYSERGLGVLREGMVA